MAEFIEEQLLLGNRKIVVGDSKHDLLFKTLGKIYIQHGSGYKKLDEYLKLSLQLDAAVVRINDGDDTSNIKDNTLILSTNNNLYIKIDGKLLLLSSGTYESELPYINKHGDVIDGQLTFEAPFKITSSDIIHNLNAQYLEGYGVALLALLNSDVSFNSVKAENLFILGTSIDDYISLRERLGNGISELEDVSETTELKNILFDDNLIRLNYPQAIHKKEDEYFTYIIVQNDAGLYVLDKVFILASEISESAEIVNDNGNVYYVCPKSLKIAKGMRTDNGWECADIQDKETYYVVGFKKYKNPTSLPEQGIIYTEPANFVYIGNVLNPSLLNPNPTLITTNIRKNQNNNNILCSDAASLGGEFYGDLYVPSSDKSKWINVRECMQSLMDNLKGLAEKTGYQLKNIPEL